MAQILIIDDEELVRLSLRQILEGAGHIVFEAVDGAQGITMVKALVPDIIVSDILMPTKEGIETIGELRKSNPDLPIVAVSGGGRDGQLNYLSVAKVVGANAVVKKPFTKSEILAAVDQAQMAFKDCA